MEYLVLFVVLVLFLMIKSASERRRRERELEQKLRDRFGTLSEEEYSEEKYRSIQYYFRSRQNDPGVIDDITWNDLDMDRIYQAFNQTSCAMGEEYLYDLLRRPLYEKQALKERERLIAFFAERTEERIRLATALAKIGKFPQISLYEYYQRAMDLTSLSVLPDLLQAVFLLLAIPLTFFVPAVGGSAIALLVAVNVVTYFQRKKRIEPYLQVVAFLVRLTRQAEELRSLSLPGLEAYQETILTGAAAFANFRRGAWLINSGSSMSGDLADIVMDYIRILFHVDLIKFASMVTTIRKHRQELDSVYETIGLLDSCMAAASFRAYLPEWCIPALENDQEKPALSAVGLYHPLLEEPVKNSIDTERSVLITGSNASGKSTFLKTVAINAILAQTLATAACSSYRGCFFRIYSSMALSDNLFGKESYYMVEIKSLKRILDAAGQANGASCPVFCCIDEVLRGTNTLERIAASSQILSVLAKKPVLAFVATHDLELTQILEAQYDNYHFSEEVQENDVRFDYRLKPGRAQSRNAIRLLSLLGFPEELTEAAREQAEHFLSKQEWKRL